MYKAIASGDADAAGRAMRQHVLDSKQRTQLNNAHHGARNNTHHNAAPPANPATAAAASVPRKKVTHA